MEKREILRRFFNFLKVNGAYENFVYNSNLKNKEKVNRNLVGSESLPYNGRELLNHAFTWCFTHEGREYWGKLDNKYRDLYYNGEGVIYDVDELFPTDI